MAEGVEIARGYISVSPEISKAAFAASGDIAGKAFSSEYTAEVRRGVASLQQTLRREAASHQAIGSELGAGLGKGVNSGLMPHLNETQSLFRRTIGSINANLNSLDSSPFSVMSGNARRAASGIHTSMEEASASVSRLARTIGITAFNMQLLGGALTRYITAPVTLAVGVMDKIGLGMAMTIENAQVSLKAFLPVGYDVESLINRLKKESIESPVFDLGQILQFTKGLVGAGLEVSKAEKEVQALDRIFTTYNVTGAQVTDMLLGFSQVQSKGIAQSEELTKQISQQIPIWPLLAQVMGKTQAEVREMVANKDISGEAFADLVIKMGELDSIQRGSAEGAKTLSAQWSMLKENMATALGVGFLANFPAIKKALDDIKPLLFEMIGNFTTSLPTIIKHFGDFVLKVKELKAAYDSLTPEQKTFIKDLIRDLVLAGPALLAMGQLTSGIGALIQVFALLSNPSVLIGGGIILALFGIGLAAKDAYDHNKKFHDEWDKFTEAVRTGWDDEIKPRLIELRKEVGDLTDAFDHLMKSLFGDNVSGKTIGEALVKTISFLVDGVKSGVDTLGNAVDKLAGIIDKVKAGNDRIIDIYKAKVGQPTGQGEGAGQMTPAKDEGYWDKWWENIKSVFSFKIIPDFIDLLGQWDDAFDKWANDVGDKIDKKLKQSWLGFQIWWKNEFLQAFKEGFAAYLDAQSSFFDTMISGWSAGWSKAFSIYDTFHQGLQTTTTLMLSMIGEKIQVFVTVLQEIFRTIWSSITEIWKNTWNGITDKFTEFKNGMTSTINGLVDSIGNAMERIRGVAARPVNFVINEVYTKGIAKLVNSVASVLGLGFELPKVDGIPGFAAGGQIPGHPSSRDNMLAMVATGEYIMPTDKTARYYPYLEAMRSGTLPGFEGGGIAGGLGNAWNWITGKGSDFAAGTVMRTISPLINTLRDSLGGMSGSGFSGIAQKSGTKIIDAMIAKITEKDVAARFVGASGGNLGSGGRSVERLIKMVADSGLNYSVNSTDRPGANDYHGSGRAVDFGGNMSGIAKYFMQYAGSLLELIHGDSGSFVKNGRAGAGLYDAATIAQHASWGGNEHVHVAMNGDAILGALGGGGSVGGSVGSWINEAAKYVSIEWIEGLNTLIQRESGGNPRSLNTWDINAQNGDPSGGLMQTIGATFRAFRDPRLPNDMFDPVANIVAGMNYIHSRYGSLANVQQAHAEMSPMGYDNGGDVRPGDTLVRNRSGKTESLFNHRQSNAILDALNGPGGDRVVNVDLDLGEGISERIQITIDRNNRATVSKLRGGRGVL